MPPPITRTGAFFRILSRAARLGYCAMTRKNYAIALAVVLALVLIIYVVIRVGCKTMASQSFTRFPSGIYDQGLLPYRIAYDPARYSELNDL